MPNKPTKPKKRKPPKPPCPMFTEEQKLRGFICVDGKVSIDKKKAKEYKRRKFLTGY